MTTHISYHPQTGIALGPVTLGVSPLEPDAVISQAYATPKLLPDVPPGHVACYLDTHGAPPYSYTDGDWIIRRDWRDVPLYQHNGQHYVIGELADGRAFDGLGELPGWLVEVAPPGLDMMWDGAGWVVDAERQAAAAAKARADRAAAIAARLTQIDLDSVRPLRAKLAGTATASDDDKLAGLESEAAALREELRSLSA